MSNLKNSVHLTGFAGSDLVVTPFENNKKVARVSVAINEYYKNKNGEESKQTQWFNLVFWNGKADDAVKLIKKGSEIAIVGKLASQTYTSKEGLKRFITEIVVNEVELVVRTVAAVAED
ncbi:single-stranded DNA-binding protein [Pedobacter insulae]|uniref:Single-stranded DNA-binding protein n=1 Tax=Pedobacter insulae TaxID=414048 RepID=A0A1I2Y561_9SPHI|nr:single-stranded DNA-binding protein [Pedobacter insulae]SFH20489.1 single-strand binding protein [Pedobacter insulae]